MTPCPKCGCKTWDGPRYVPAVKGIEGHARIGLRGVIAEPDYLSYTCTDCRFVRYEAPLDRQDKALEG